MDLNMEKKELKKIMTDLAKGKISQKEVDLLIKSKKTHPEALKQQIKGKPNTHKRKKIIKSKEVK